MKLHLYEFMKSIKLNMNIYTKNYKFDFKNYMNCTKNYENVNYISIYEYEIA